MFFAYYVLQFMFF